jgi:hypothetical protein
MCILTYFLLCQIKIMEYKPSYWELRNDLLVVDKKNEFDRLVAFLGKLVLISTSYSLN